LHTRRELVRGRTDDGVWSVYLGAVLPGRLDEREMKVYG
jgi:hypothetical protein